jgi:serine/threonine protein kinase
MEQGGPDAATELVPRTVARRLGRYTIVDELARGGMAQLYIARREGAREICVLKRLLGELETDEVAAKRFQREAVVAQCLEHPNIVRTLDAGFEGGVFCIASEFIAGLSLETIITKRREAGARMPVEIAVGIARRVLDALAYAHEVKDREGRALEIVHRDLSPRNILVSYAGEVKIIDFGVVHGRIDEFKTAPGVVVGSLEYMSPEQALTHPIDRRSDIYTLGVVLYEMLSGRPMVKDEKLMDLLSSIVRDEPQPITAFVPELPKSVAAALHKALAKSPDQRFSTAGEFRAALAEVPLLANHVLAAYLKMHFADSERAVIDLLERARRSFEEELEEIARPPAPSSPDKLAKYEPTALVMRKRARAGQRDRLKLPGEDAPAAAFIIPPDGSKGQSGSEFTKLGAVVLDMPGEPAPLTKNSVVRVQMELLRRSNRFLRFSVAILGIVATGLGIAALVTMRQTGSSSATLVTRATHEPSSDDPPRESPSVVARAGAPEAETAETAPAVTHPPSGESGLVKKRVEEHPRHEDTKLHAKTKAPEHAPETNTAAKTVETPPASEPPRPPNPHEAELAHLQKMLADLRASPKDANRFDKLVKAVQDSAKTSPQPARKYAESDLNDAIMNFDVEALGRAVEVIIRAKTGGR